MANTLTIPQPDEQWGPALAALTDRQRKFVLALLTQTRQNLTQAAKDAGYSDVGESASTRGIQLSHHPAVLKAIHEEAERRIKSGGVLAANVLISIAGDPLHKDRLKAAQALLASGGLGPIAINRTTVEHTVSDEAMLARVRELSSYLGVDATKLLGRVRGLPPPKSPAAKLAESNAVIEADFVEIDPTQEADPDMNWQAAEPGATNAEVSQEPTAVGEPASHEGPDSWHDPTELDHDGESFVEDPLESERAQSGLSSGRPASARAADQPGRVADNAGGDHQGNDDSTASARSWPTKAAGKRGFEEQRGVPDGYEEV